MCCGHYTQSVADITFLGIFLNSLFITVFAHVEYFCIFKVFNFEIKVLNNLFFQFSMYKFLADYIKCYHISDMF